MRIFVISDTHFGHNSLSESYLARPADFEQRIIDSWKRTVSEKDLVIHLGDFVIGDTAYLNKIINQLPGRKILVLGNHDKKTEAWYMINGFAFCCSYFAWEKYGLKIVFSHEPLIKGEFDLNIHGHLHMERHRDTFTGEKNYLVSLEKTGYSPLTLEYIIKDFRRRKPESSKATN